MRATRRRVAVVTDSTAALPPGAAARWGITVVPLDVVVDGRRHVEGVSLTSEALVEALRRGAKVSTSQPSPEAFSRAYASAAATGAEAVVSVHLSGDMSGTVAAAHSAAERAPLPVHVVDSRTTAMALGFAALAAAWAAAGVPPDEQLVVPPPGPGAPGGSLAPRASGLRRVRDLLDPAGLRRLPDALRRPAAPGPDEVVAAARSAASAAAVWFLVDSLEHLRRGGRLSAPAAALGTVLGLRPLLTVAEGKVVVAEKIRGRRAARGRLEAVAVAAAGTHDGVRLAVHHLGEPDVAAQLAAHVAAEAGPRVREVVVAEAGAVLGAHVGPGLLAIVVAPA
ncbi:MAG TPA: DegV family protein [Cellulomonas sp.]